MSPRLFHTILQRATASPPDTDAALLGRFVKSHDEQAFAELVRRYCGLVWGQCRNLLHNETDAEDAFQATFVVLSRKAKTIRCAVGPYLHGVAYRVCLNARRLAGRRKQREVASATSEAERPVADSAWDAALAAVHDELHRLPESQRVAFVLCVLEGRGLTDAAAHLGVKLGTLSARLSRAKQALMDRLAAKGLVAGIAAVSALAPAGVTASLVEKAVQSAVGAQVVPVVVQSLTQGVTKMFALKAKVLAAAVVLATGLGLGIGSGWVANAQDKPKASPAGEQRPASEPPGLKYSYYGPNKPVPGEAEFRYVHLSENDSMSMTKKSFEKAVKANETDGYLFIGALAIRTEEPLEGGSQAAAVPTLVFRKKPVDKLVASADLMDSRQQLLSKYEEQKMMEGRLKQQWEDLSAKRAQLDAQAKQAEAEQQHLRAQINAMEDRLKKNPVAAKPAAAPEKLFGVNFDKVPWPKVLLWLAVEANLTVTDNGAVPSGTCTLKLDRKVTIGELMDLFNEALAQQKMTLLRGEQTLRFWPADERLPKISVRSVPVEDLHKFGKSEVVRVALPLDDIAAADAQKLAKKLLSQFGEVTTIAEKQLVIIDQVHHVRAVIAALDGQPKPKPADKLKPKWVDLDLGPKGHDELVNAITTLAARKYAGRPNAPHLLFDGDSLKVFGDADAVKWVTDLIDSLKK